MMEEISDIEVYDRVVTEYLSTIVGKDRVIYAPTSNAVPTITNRIQNRDSIPWAFISFYRDSNFAIDLERFNFNATTLGEPVRLREICENKRSVTYVRDLPVNLTYNVDIWSAKEKHVQKHAIALISKIYMTNQVLVAQLVGSEKPQRFHITDCQWVDNSDLESETDKGKLYRHTITFTIDARIKLTLDTEDCPLCYCGRKVDIYNDNEVNNENS